jgi:hypothetical protein
VLGRHAAGTCIADERGPGTHYHAILPCARRETPSEMMDGSNIHHRDRHADFALVLLEPCSPPAAAAAVELLLLVFSGGKNIKVLPRVLH